MARPKISVDRELLQTLINRVEKKANFDSLSAMFAAVAETKEAKKIGATVSVITLRYKEFSLSSKTTPGKRGRRAGEKSAEPFAPKVTELDGAGRGRKQCAACKKYVGVRSSVCVCGNPFTKAERTAPVEQTVAIPTRTERTAPIERPTSDEQPTIYDIRTFGFQKVYIPAGECPVKLSGHTEKEVLRWMESVCKWYEDKKQLIGFEGLAYYVRMEFFSFDTKEYEKVKDILRAQWRGERDDPGNFKRA